MWSPKTEIADLNLLERAQRDSRRGSIGWLGVLTSIAVALAGQLTKLSGGATAAISASLLAASVVLINWTRLWVGESKKPFQYTFSVADFTAQPEPDRPESASDQTGEVLSWFARDLIASLGDRVPRLSLLQVPDGAVEDADHASSHLHISGWYGIRRAAEGARSEFSQRWQLEVIPQVRLGGIKAPAKLGQAVRYDIGESDDRAGNGSDAPPPVTRDQYRAAFERVYWSVASKIYSEIGRGVEAKVNLLPPGRLRAAAYLYEADDYATSNTLDAYAEALRFYRKARELYDIGACAEPATEWRRRLRRLRVRIDLVGRKARQRMTARLRAAGRREVLTARAELGQARMMIAEWHMKQLCGTQPSEIFEAGPLTEHAIERLRELPEDVEERNETMLRGQLTLALARCFMRDEAGAEECLREAKRFHPVDANRNAEFLFVSGMNEPARRRSLRILRQAVELDPKMERAQFHYALRFDDVWRSRPTFEPEVALMADREYSAVVAIDPGNLAAWANRGYVAWLLAEGEDGDDWRDRAFTSLEAGRQYKEVRREAVVSELDWNLARLAAESGEFSKAYKRYIEAVSAQLGDTSLEFMDYFYENAGEALQKRFIRYRKEVFRQAKGLPASEKRLIDSVKAFVLNDCGVAYFYYHARSGEEKALDRARDSFEDAIDTNEAFVLPALNLAKLHYFIWETGPAGAEKDGERSLRRASDLLKEVLRREPEWAAAQLLMVDVQAQLASQLAAARRRLKERDAPALPGSLVPRLTYAEEPGSEEEISSGVVRLEVERLKCHRELEHQLRRMLPHDCFFASPANGADSSVAWPEDGADSLIDARGTHIGSLLSNEGIDWYRDFSEVHVAALIGWATALAADPASARPAFDLCELLRRVYYRADERVLLAHWTAARALLDSAPPDAPESKRLFDAIKSCENLLRDHVGRILNDDPGHYNALTNPTFEWFPEDERQQLLFNARDANPSPATQLVVGERLYGMSEHGAALALFEKAAARGGTSVTSVAMMRIGDIRVEMDTPTAAVDPYRNAALSGNAQVAPEAAVKAGRILGEAGQAAEALELYEEVAGTSPEVAIDLGRALELTSAERDAAISVYRIALERNRDSTRAAPAGLFLAGLLEPGSTEAEKALRIALASADDEIRASTQIRLAETLLDKPKVNREEVEDLLRGALDSSSPRARGKAAIVLARELRNGPGKSEAERLYSRAIEEGDASAANVAALELGEILEEAGEHEKALKAFKDAARVDSWTALSLARSLQERGDIETAKELCRIGAKPDGPNPLFAPDAALLLGEMLLAENAREEAEKALWQAIKSNDLTVMPSAALKLSALYAKRGQPTALAYESAIRFMEFPTALSFVRSLGPLLIEQGDRGDALAAYMAAAKTDPWAALQVGEDLEGLNETEAAEDAYRTAIAQPESGFEADALLRLAALVEQRSPEDAAAIYRQVVESADLGAAETATQRLAEISARLAPAS